MAIEETLSRLTGDTTLNENTVKKIFDLFLFKKKTNNFFCRIYLI